MATYKIYVKNNYLFVECDKPKYIASGFAKNVFVKPVDATTFSISGLEVKSCETLVIKLSDMVDEDGTPYTLSTFTEFYTKYTGNFSSTPGGSGVIENGLLIEDEDAGGTIDPSAALDIQTTGKGVLFPRMTTVQRDAIVSPANYLTIVNTDTHRVEFNHPTFGWTVIGYIEPLEVASVAISFTDLTTYNSVASPGTGNITNNLTGAKKGIIQKIYHNHTSAPTVPAGWVNISNSSYVDGVLNIIYAEFAGGARVEYWFAQ